MKADKIIGAVEGVTRKWAKQRKREEHERFAVMNRRQAMSRRQHVSIKAAAWWCMEDAYLKASGGGRLPAHARQVMYAARPYTMSRADRELGQKFDQYFTQTLLPDYIEEKGVNWNIVFDARGHFHEPHTEKMVPLGTLEVRDYLRDIDSHEVEELTFDIGDEDYPTLGPKHRYGAILFIEKEGFMPLFKAVQLAERYDLAIMSTKGMSVTASRQLVDDLAGDHDIPLLVLHDFDKSGFSIVGTLQRDTRRYAFMNDIKVTDLGIRMGDIAGLVTEQVVLDGTAAANNLAENGATPEEINFLMHDRVELNAFPSDQFITWIEGKLHEHGIKKVIPDDATLVDAYRRARRQMEAQKRIDEILASLKTPDKDIPVPKDLRARIKAQLRRQPATQWDSAIRSIARRAA